MTMISWSQDIAYDITNCEQRSEIMCDSDVIEYYGTKVPLSLR
jgi:hypothetical protein